MFVDQLLGQRDFADIVEHGDNLLEPVVAIVGHRDDRGERVALGGIGRRRNRNQRGLVMPRQEGLAGGGIEFGKALAGRLARCRLDPVEGAGQGFAGVVRSPVGEHLGQCLGHAGGERPGGVGDRNQRVGKGIEQLEPVRAEARCGLGAWQKVAARQRGRPQQQHRPLDQAPAVHRHHLFHHCVSPAAQHSRMKRWPSV